MIGCRILLIDDYADTASVVSRLLGRFGYRVTAVPDVAAATAACRQEHFDLLIADLGPPDGSGHGAMAAFLADRSFPAIAFTASAMPVDRQRARKAGFREFIPKPAPIDDLLAAIDRICAERSQDRAELVHS